VPPVEPMHVGPPLESNSTFHSCIEITDHVDGVFLRLFPWSGPNMLGCWSLQRSLRCQEVEVREGMAQGFEVLVVLEVVAIPVNEQVG
jgi:hypothetical protein